jgi:phosphopantothenoylcysteine decarboxylase / phosphopantothenate---cysteine ligase
VESAAEMQAAVVPRARRADVVVMAAAVADFRPVSAADHKLKKDEGAEARDRPRAHPRLPRRPRRGQAAGQVLVGFAAETDDLRRQRPGKLERKHLDLIVANDVSAPGVGFEHDTNAS